MDYLASCMFLQGSEGEIQKGLPTRNSRTASIHQVSISDLPERMRPEEEV